MIDFIPSVSNVIADPRDLEKTKKDNKDAVIKSYRDLIKEELDNILKMYNEELLGTHTISIDRKSVV